MLFPQEMRRNLFIVFLLLIFPALASAEEGKKSNRWWSTPLIIVVYIGFFLIAAGVAFVIRHYRERRRINIDYRNGLSMAAERGLAAEEIESLPSLRYSEMKMHKLEEGDQQLECAVCLSEFKDQEVVRVLPDCLHVFHPSCIAPWLATHITCPICRLDYFYTNVMTTNDGNNIEFFDVIYKVSFEHVKV